MFGIYESAIVNLLKHAENDLKASKILYENNLMYQSLYHLEQASEKILKAYFISVIVHPLKDIVDIAERLDVASKYRNVHYKLKSAVYNYIVPKNLGHAFSGYLTEFMPWIYKAYCSGQLIDYINATLKAWLPDIKRRKERIIKYLMDKGLTREVADKIYQLFIYTLSQPTPIAIDEDTRKHSCNKARVEFGDSLEQLRKAENPCLEKAVSFLKYVEGVAEKAYKQILVTYKDVLGKKIGELLEVTEVPDIIPRHVLELSIEEFLKKIVISNIVLFMTLPLHFCLLKYYNVARYGEGVIPEDEFKTIPLTISILTHVHELAKSLILIDDNAKTTVN